MRMFHVPSHLSPLIALFLGRHQRGVAFLQSRECQDGEWSAEHNHHPQDQQIQGLQRKDKEVLRRRQAHTIWYGPGVE